MNDNHFAVHLKLTQHCKSTTIKTKKRKKKLDFLAGTVTRNLPTNAVDMSLIPGLEDFACHRATKPVHHHH